MKRSTRHPISLSARLGKLEREIDCLENTLRGVTREMGDLSVNGPCRLCEQSLLLISGDRVYCPHCSYSTIY